MKTVGLLIGGKTARREVQDKPAKPARTRKPAKTPEAEAVTTDDKTPEAEAVTTDDGAGD